MSTSFFFATLVLIGIFIGIESKSPWVLPGQVVDGPSADERAAFFNSLWKDFLKQNPPHQPKAVRRPEIMPTIAKARRAPLEAFDEWEGMMESLDNLRKPRYVFAEMGDHIFITLVLQILLLRRFSGDRN